MYNLAAVGSTLYFRAYDVTNGYELWKSDGTSSGTVMVKDINSGSSSSFPYDLTAVGNTLYFQANDGTNGEELWKSDGTASGTVMVKDINPGSSNGDIYYLTAVGYNFYFRPYNFNIFNEHLLQASLKSINHSLFSICNSSLETVHFSMFSLAPFY